MTSPGRAHEILARVIVTAATEAPGAAAETLPAGLCHGCARDLPMTGVAIVLQGTAGLDRVVAATDGLATAVEQLQFEFGEGPGVDAVRRGGPVLRPDLTAWTRRWPLFAPAAAGVGAVFAFPLRVGGITLGALDLYRDTPGQPVDGALSEALAYAQAATAVLLHLQSLTQPVSELHTALIGFSADRAEVHQATGMIAAQADVTPGEALLLLRARAYADDLTIGQVSRQVLARRLRFDGGIDTDTGIGIDTGSGAG